MKRATSFLRTTGYSLAAVALASLIACGSDNDDDDGSNGNATSGGASGDTEQASNDGTPGGTGFTGPNFSFNVDQPIVDRAPDYADYANAFYRQVIAPLNRVQGLLGDTVPVTFTDCGFANAFYRPNQRDITLCSEFSDQQYEVLREAGLSEQDAGERSDFVMAFVLNHEIGHALIDILELPAIGNNESAADAIATVLSVESSKNTDFVPYSLMGALSLASQPESYGGEHPGGQDRAGDIMCWTIGGRTQLLFIPELQELVEPFVQAGRDCVAEYQNQLSTVTSWLPGYTGSPKLEQPIAAAQVADIVSIVRHGGLRPVPVAKRGTSAARSSVYR